MSAPPPNAGGRRQKLHGLVIVEDGAVQHAMVMKLAKSNCQATVCSDINAAVKLLRERMKEIDIVVVSDALSRLKPAIMNLQLLCEEAELRLNVLRKDEKEDKTWVLKSYSRMKEELESIRRSTMINRDDSHAYRPPVAASPHRHINGLTATMVNRATNQRKGRLVTAAAKQVISTQTQGQDVQEQSTQHQQKKTRLVWTTELNKKFEEAYKKLSLTGEAVPNKILTLMKLMINPMDGLVLTRGNISSHLQKYRGKQKDQHVHVNVSTNPISIQRQQNILNFQMAHRVLAILPQHTARTVFNLQKCSPEHQIQATGVVDMSTAQASWRGAMTHNVHSISQVHQHDYEPPTVYFSNNTNDISKENNYRNGLIFP